MKYICCIVCLSTLSLFSINVSFSQPKLLNDLLNKPTSKTEISLNSDNEKNWKLWFGPQDRNAPQTPKELLASGFKQIDAIVFADNLKKI